MATVKPGVTGVTDVFMSTPLVTIEWEVTETTIEDKYIIVLHATFETDVPWPPSDRDVEMPVVDRVVVTVEFTHEYLTGFIGDSVTWTASKLMRIEPQG